MRHHVHPRPTDDEAAAIAAALVLLGTTQATEANQTAGRPDDPTLWRFSLRDWQ